MLVENVLYSPLPISSIVLTPAADAYKAPGGKGSVLDYHQLALCALLSASVGAEDTPKQSKHSPPSPGTRFSALLIADGTVGRGGVFLTMVDAGRVPRSVRRNDIYVWSEAIKRASDRAIASVSAVEGWMVEC